MDAEEFQKYEEELSAQGLEISPIGPVKIGECDDIISFMKAEASGYCGY